MLLSSSPRVYDDNVSVLFQTSRPVLFSRLREKAFEKSWDSWKPRTIQLRADCTLQYRKEKEIQGRLDLSRVSVTKVAVDQPSNLVLVKREVGVHVVCLADKVQDEIHFRCVLQEDELDTFLLTLKSMAKQHNIDTLTQDTLRAVSNDLNLQIRNAGLGDAYFGSVMRRTVAKAMEKFETRSRKAQIISRRGALKWLPVLCENDLIHGSWWFVVGSLFVVIASSITLVNSFDAILGTDDSFLSRFHYRATWVLMVISGSFFTLGSLAFVRAVHEPPLHPMFPSCYHLQSDELIGSWNFLFAALPFVPYALIYLAEADTPESKILYLGALCVAILVIIGSFLFVRACYPSEKARKQYILPWALCCFTCCCSERWLQKHLANDWLAGCWALFWATLLSTIGCGVMLFVALADKDGILTFIYSTSFVENLLFLFGSAYFVSGSYPEYHEVMKRRREENHRQTNRNPNTP